MFVKIKKYTLTASNASAATNIPVTEPALKAIDRPFERSCDAACAVLTFALTDISIPTNPAIPDKIAPIAKPTATIGSNK